MQCVVAGCWSKKAFNPKGVSFHKFPSDGPRRAIWLRALNLVEEDISKHTIVCSEHFRQEAIFRLPKRAVLRMDAVPELKLSCTTTSTGTISGSQVHVAAAGESSVTFVEAMDTTYFSRQPYGPIPGEHVDAKCSTSEPMIDIRNTLASGAQFGNFPVSTEILPAYSNVSVSLDHATYSEDCFEQIEELMPAPNFAEQSHGVSLIEGVNGEWSVDTSLMNLSTLPHEMSVSGEWSGDALMVDMNGLPIQSQYPASTEMVQHFRTPSFIPPSGSAASATTADGCDEFLPARKRMYKHTGLLESRCISQEGTVTECRTLTDAMNSAVCIECVKKDDVIVKLESKILKLNKKLAEGSKGIRTLRRQNTRYKKKLQQLKKPNKATILQSSGSICGANKKIAERQLSAYRSSRGKKYDPELRAFALNLNFISPKAYEYVRTVFMNCLPHNRTLRKWYEGVNCAPGFTKESFDAIKRVVESTPNERIIVNLAFDEIHIRRHIQWDGQRALGYVDLGDGECSDTIATQMLVFMVVCLNKSWKIPIGYFPIASITAEQKKNMVQFCVDHLKDTGVIVVGVTFDGLYSNLSMARQLGSDIRNVSPPDENPDENAIDYILHPDPCHMLKLCRNAFAQKKVFIDKDGNLVKWEFIVQLQKLQEEEGLRLGNKLTKAHIHFERQKMKVSLASETFSDSLADAMAFCLDILRLPEFSESEATSKFIRMFNDIFDVLNSRKLSVSQPKKQALCERNVAAVLEIAKNGIEYIKGLKHYPLEEPVIASSLRVGFVGLIRCLQNLEILYRRLIETHLLKFIIMHKVSQDPLELFFGSIRTGLGCNTNPTVQQFTSRYKKLLFRVQLRDGGMGNCMPLEHIPILNATQQNAVTAINRTTERVGMLDDAESIHQDDSLNLDDNDLRELEGIIDEHNYHLNPRILSRFVVAVSEFISGFVARNLFKTLKCSYCIEAIQGEVNEGSLLAYKTRGFLKVPSKSLVFVCRKLEEEIRLAQRCGMDILLSQKTATSISVRVQEQCIGQDLFLETDAPTCMHYSLLIKAITQTYLKVRYHYEARKLSERLPIGAYLRRLAHFRND